jgi:hypothetical protein
MMTTIRTALLAGLLVPIGLGSEGPSEELKEKAEAARATPAELRYLRIPWVTDLFQGFEEARKERRPVFLYTVVGDALEDC